jgi:hypothetical protein
MRSYLRRQFGIAKHENLTVRETLASLPPHKCLKVSVSHTANKKIGYVLLVLPRNQESNNLLPWVSNGEVKSLLRL